MRNLLSLPTTRHPTGEDAGRNIRGRVFSSEPVKTLRLRLIAGLLVALAAVTGCESTDGGGSVSGSAYYGVGFSDPWYHGGYYDDADIIVTPPDRPDRPDRPVRPEQPIARPPASRPRPTPMPSIPSAPRPMPRGGGGRR